MAQLNDILFPVRVEKVKDYVGIDANRDYENLVIATIDGKDKMLTACSNRYELIPNFEIFPTIEHELSSQGVNFRSDYKMFNHARFYGELEILDNDLSIVDGGDIVRPQIKIQHSYNRSTKYTITFGFYRLVCSNGLVIPVESEHNLNIVGMHTQQIRDSIGQLFGKLERFLGTIDKSKETFEVLGDRMIPNWNERLVEVLDATGIKTRSKDNRILNAITGAIEKEANMIYDGKVNDWLIYNGINQGFVFNDEMNKKFPEIRQNIDKKVFDYILESH